MAQTNSLSQMGGIQQKFINEKLRRTVSRGGLIKAGKEENIIEWDTLFRRNWDIYAELILGVKLKPFQRQALHLLGVSDVFFWRASRGTSKTFISALAAIVKLMLYPNSWIVVTASTSDQANKIVEDKIVGEIILKLSPYLLYFYQNRWIEVTKPGDGYVIKNTLNGSTLKVLAPVPSSKGSRSTFTIYDEVAIMKKGDIDDIFDGMLFPRQAVYLSNPLYAKNKRWVEESKAIYLTSSYYQFMWWYKTWRDCVSGYYIDKRTRYNVYASDFFVSIDANLKTWGDYRRAKKINGDIEFRMNYLNEAVGNSEDAFFSLESFKNNQILNKCFRPPTPTDIIMGNDLGNKPKKDKEVRLVVADFAWTETKGGGNESDRSVAICMSGHWKRDYFERHIDYIELLPTADDPDACADRVRELFWLYDADYAVPDARSNGEAIMHSFSKPYTTGLYGTGINNCGLMPSDKDVYQVADSNKVEYYRNNIVDKNSLPCIIPIIGSASLNTAYWKSTKQALERNRVKFLIGAADAQANLEDTGEYFKMDSNQIVNAILPYGQTDELITEAVNLKTNIKNDNIQLTAPRSGHRDRIVTMAMGMLIFDLIEREWTRQENVEDYDIENMQLIW